MTKADKILISVFVIISIFGMIGIFYFHSDVEKKHVVIEVDNQLVERIAIDNTTKAQYSFNFGKGIGVVK